MEGEVLEYTRMIVPSTMRSRYWKYFGFPSDNFNNIVTRKKIICTLCNGAIAYNKNTTNLRTHLVAKHPDILIQLNQERREKRTSEPDNTPEHKRPKLLSGAESPSEPSDLRCDGAMHMKLTNSIIDALTTDNIIEKNEDATTDYNDYASNLQPDYEIEEIDGNNIEPDANFTDLLQDMLVKDLLSPAFIEGQGFRNLTWTLCGNSSSPPRRQMDVSIAKMYEELFGSISNKIKTHSKENNFALGIELWQNVDKRSWLSIYYNYVSLEPETVLNNVLFKTVDMRRFRFSVQEVFEDFNLKNCTGVVINVEDSRVCEFFSKKEVPVALCFETIISRCLQAAFSSPGIAILLDEIVDYFEKSETICDTIPDILEEYPWTKYNALKCFYDHVSWTAETNEMLIKAKGIIDCITPLKVTLETLADEQMPLSSLVKPLTLQLMEQYFCAYECDIEIVLEVKEKINQELTRSVLSSDFLTECTFLDPRFHQRFIDPDGIQTVRNNFMIKISKTEEFELKQIKVENLSNPRKSSLTLFFNKSDQDQKPVKINSRNSLEVEITKYVSETCADLEQCPLAWWNEVGYIYRYLKKIAEKYVCMPCCVNLLFKRGRDEHIEFLNRRHMLSAKYVRTLWFLHYNKDCLL